MSRANPPNMFLALPRQRPVVQREYTASPPTRHACTPNISHGFIPLGTTTPLPTATGERSSCPNYDYFSLKKKEATISPDAGSYKSHGFIPLCSVAAVEKDEETSDYFSHFEVPANTQASAATSTSTSSTSKHFSSPQLPRRLDLTDKTRLLNDEMMHPTGSPVHPRDVFLPSIEDDCDSQRKLDLTLPTEGEQNPFPSMRGGAIHDPAEYAFEAERSRCSLTGISSNDTVETPGFNDELSRTKPSSLEEVVSEHVDFAHAGIEPNRRESVGSHKEERGTFRQSWETEWLRIAEALELPVSESSEEDGHDDIPVETQVRANETSPQALQNANNAADPRTASLIQTESHPNDCCNSLGIDTPIPGLPSNCALQSKTSCPGPSTTDFTQNIPPANLLTVPRPQRLPRLDKRQSSPVCSAASFIQLKQSNQSAGPSPVPRPPPQSPSPKRRSAPIPPNLTILKTAMYTDARYLTSLLSGPTISITSSQPPRVLIPSVPLSMLLHFCPQATISPLLSADSSTLTLPNNATYKPGLSRVLRFMTRCCLPHSHFSSSELPIPTGDVSAGIETVLACQGLGLHADATRLTRLIISTQLNGPLSSVMIDELWNNYHGALRSTPLGDLVVWFVLRESWKNECGRSEEVLWMLEQPEYAELKECVRAEVGLRLWRKESREEFLGRWEADRARRQRREGRNEAVERERRARVEEIRRRNREVKERIGDGGSKELATKARRLLNLDVDKALPKTLGTPQIRVEGEMGDMMDGDDERDSTAAMYAAYARSTGVVRDNPQRREVGMQKYGERVGSSSSIRVGPERQISMHGTQSWKPWVPPRADRVPRKKLTLWEKLKI